MGSYFPNQGSNPCPLLLKWSLDHWTTREVPHLRFHSTCGHTAGWVISRHRFSRSENFSSQIYQYFVFPSWKGPKVWATRLRKPISQHPSWLVEWGRRISPETSAPWDTRDLRFVHGMNGEWSTAGAPGGLTPLATHSWTRKTQQHSWGARVKNVRVLPGEVSHSGAVPRAMSPITVRNGQSGFRKIHVNFRAILWKSTISPHPTHHH